MYNLLKIISLLLMLSNCTTLPPKSAVSGIVGIQPKPNDIRQQSKGNGFIIAYDDIHDIVYILTQYHVFEGDQNPIIFFEGGVREKAEIVRAEKELQHIIKKRQGFEPNGDYALALLSVQQPTRKMKLLKFGLSEDCSGVTSAKAYNYFAESEKKWGRVGISNEAVGFCLFEEHHGISKGYSGTPLLTDDLKVISVLSYMDDEGVTGISPSHVREFLQQIRIGGKLITDIMGNSTEQFQTLGNGSDIHSPSEVYAIPSEDSNYTDLLLVKRPIVMPDVPSEFETAIRGLTNDLLRQVENHQRKTLQSKKLSEAELPKINIVLRPFIEADTGYTVTLSKAEEDATAQKNIKAIGKNSEELILSEVAERTTCQDEFCPKEGCQKEVIVFSPNLGQCPKDSEVVKRFEKISISPWSQESLKQADYMMYGVFRLEPSLFSQSTKEIEKRYRAYAILVDEKVRPKKVIARSDTWIANKAMVAIPSREPSGSPIYLKDTGLEELLRQVINTRPEDLVTAGISSEVDAIIADASTAFGKGEMDNALALYKKAEQLPGGKQLKVYSSLYQIYYQQGSLPEAKEVLAQMVALGVANKELSFKFLFKVNSVEFGVAKANMSETEETLNWVKQYPLWIESIGRYFETSDECFEIIGHAAYSSKPEYNRELSLRRANRIKTLITEKFKSVNAKVSSVQGKGHDDCSLLEPKGICTGTDDERDAYDRRVEFKVVDCPQTPNPASK